jgi:hypothetical protein
LFLDEVEQLDRLTDERDETAALRRLGDEAPCAGR